MGPRLPAKPTKRQAGATWNSPANSSHVLRTRDSARSDFAAHAPAERPGRKLHRKHPKVCAGLTARYLRRRPPPGLRASREDLRVRLREALAGSGCVCVDCYNPSANSANEGFAFLHQVCLQRGAAPQDPPFFQPGMARMEPGRKEDPQPVPCHNLNGANTTPRGALWCTAPASTPSPSHRRGLDRPDAGTAGGRGREPARSTASPLRHRTSSPTPPSRRRRREPLRRSLAAPTLPPRTRRREPLPPLRRPPLRRRSRRREPLPPLHRPLPPRRNRPPRPLCRFAALQPPASTPAPPGASKTNA